MYFHTQKYAPAEPWLVRDKPNVEKEAVSTFVRAGDTSFKPMPKFWARWIICTKLKYMKYTPSYLSLYTHQEARTVSGLCSCTLMYTALSRPAFAYCYAFASSLVGYMHRQTDQTRPDPTRLDQTGRQAGRNADSRHTTETDGRTDGERERERDSQRERG